MIKHTCRNYPAHYTTQAHTCKYYPSDYDKFDKNLYRLNQCIDCQKHYIVKKDESLWRVRCYKCYCHPKLNHVGHNTITYKSLEKIDKRDLQDYEKSFTAEDYNEKKQKKPMFRFQPDDTI